MEEQICWRDQPGHKADYNDGVSVLARAYLTSVYSPPIGALVDTNTLESPSLPFNLTFL
jgi:hypothetical protein